MMKKISLVAIAGVFALTAFASTVNAQMPNAAAMRGEGEGQSAAAKWRTQKAQNKNSQRPSQMRQASKQARAMRRGAVGEQ